MAAARHTARQRRYDTERQRNMYVYGNAVPKQEVAPKRTPKKSPGPKATARRKAHRKKNATVGINPVYMAFLSAAAAVAVIICVGYLCLQAEIVNRSERVASLQEELADLNEQNTTAYNAAESSVNLEAVWERATGRWGWCMPPRETWWNMKAPRKTAWCSLGTFRRTGLSCRSKGNHGREEKEKGQV